jgi:hypothetical protein
MQTNEINQNRVVLQLLGIEKKWVRSSEGEWVDKKTLKKENNQVSIALEPSSKRWWKFWGK